MTAIALNAVMSTVLAIAACRFDWRRNFWKTWSATFRTLVGMTPHQFILHTRMKRAAVSLRRTSENVSAIAFAAGFGDLSTFNRRFQRIFGSSPSAYRAESQRR
jgi:AraC-like DNA-binding protein